MLNERLSEVESFVRNHLSDRRAAHTFRVADMAERILSFAGMAFEDEIVEAAKEGGMPSFREQLMAASLLHDVTKEESFEKQLQVLENFAIMSVTDAKQYTPVLHGKTATRLIAERFPYYDLPRVRDAVSYHTTGCADMAPMTAILFLADYIEDGRQYDRCIQARTYFFNKKDIKSKAEMQKHIDSTLLLVLEQTVGYLTNKGIPIHGDTLSAYAFYREKLGCSSKE